MNDSHRRHRENNYDSILSEQEENYATNYLYNFKADRHIKHFRNFMAQQH